MVEERINQLSTMFQASPLELCFKTPDLTSCTVLIVSLSRLVTLRNISECLLHILYP